MTAPIYFDFRLSPKENRTIWVYLLLGLTFHYITSAIIPLTNDEAYYWDWSSMLQWSYLDHPPMVGWISGIVRAAFGDLAYNASIFPRLLSPILHLLSSIYLIRTTSLLTAEKPYQAIQATIAATILLPGLSLLGSLLLPDAPLLLGLSIAAYYTVKAIQMQTLSWTNALFIGASLGFAGLSKYHAAIIGLGLVLALFRASLLGRWFSLPPFILLIAIGLVMVTPVLQWNYANGFASFRFQGNHGFGGLNWNPFGFLQTQLALILLLTPLGFGLVYQGLIKSTPSALLWPARLGIGLFFLISMFKQVLPHWFFPAVWILIPALAVGYRYKPWHKWNLIPLITALLLLGTHRIAPETLLNVLGKDSAYASEVGVWPPLAEALIKHPTYQQVKAESLARPECGMTIITFRWFWAAQLKWYLQNKTRVLNLDANHLSYYSFRDSDVELPRCLALIVGDLHHYNPNPRLSDVEKSELAVPEVSLPLFIGTARL